MDAEEIERRVGDIDECMNRMAESMRRTAEGAEALGDKGAALAAYMAAESVEVYRDTCKRLLRSLKKPY